MSTDFRLAHTIAKDVELHSVTLCAAELSSRIDPVGPAVTLELEQGYRARYHLPEHLDDHVYVYVDLKFGGRPGEPAQADWQELFSFNATYLLVYVLPQAHTRDETALRYFAELNGTYHVWPYWRELVQSVTGRSGLASFVVPVLHLEPQQIEDNPTAADAAPAVPKRRPPRKKAVG